MIRGFNVVESEIHDDAHIVFNLSVLKSLVTLGRLDAFNCSESLYLLYEDIYPEVSAYRGAYPRRNSNYLFLTGSWRVLFKCLLLTGEKVVIFHNFYEFLENSTFRARLKRILYEILLRLGHVKPVVLNNFIRNWISMRLSTEHFVLQIYYDDEIIRRLAIEEVESISDQVIFGNLFPGKIDERLLHSMKPKHLGKLHGGFTYSKSINRYLSINEYYSFFSAASSVLILNNNNHRVASGIIADAVALGKTVISAKDDFLIELIQNYNLKHEVWYDMIKIDFAELNKMFEVQHMENLKKL